MHLRRRYIRGVPAVFSLVRTHVSGVWVCSTAPVPLALPAGGYYRPGTYLLAKLVCDALLLRVLPVLIFTAPFYPMVRPAGWSGGRGASSGLSLESCTCFCPAFSVAFRDASPHGWSPAALISWLPMSVCRLQMGLQGSSTTVGTFLLVLSTFAGGKHSCLDDLGACS
jgi:hypothetical protein